MNGSSSESQSRGGTNAAEYSVSELAGAIKRSLEEGFGYVRLRGEISGYRGPHASGHCYFALKDDKAKIEAVIWKGSFGRLRFKPEEGMEVIAQGRVTTFPGSSKYQIVIDALEPAGAGALMALLEERKRKFASEGLFDESRKKARPFLPKVVGIVTSPTGAVIRDMLHGFNERFPTRVIVWPVRVQGEGSAAEIANAIRGFNALPAAGAMPRPDVLIVARGGGSLEDLWSFNEEIVVRAAAESQIPLISAVGHETDWTLIDLVADARAPTPTKAAEWAVPKYSDLVDAVEKMQLRKRTAIKRVLGAAERELRASARGLPRPDDLVALPRQRFDSCSGRLDRSLSALVNRKTSVLARAAGRLPHPGGLVRLARHKFDGVQARLGRSLLSNTRAHAMQLARQSARLSPGGIRQRVSRCGERLSVLEARAGQALLNRIAVRRRVLDGKAALLSSLGYQSVLSRGFAVVRDNSGRTVRQAGSLSVGDRLSIEFSDGRIAARAEGNDPTDDREAVPQKATENVPRDAKTPRPKDTGRGGQGSLF